jgi:hypothetical protein
VTGVLTHTHEESSKRWCLKYNTNNTIIHYKSVYVNIPSDTKIDKNNIYDIMKSNSLLEDS